MRRTLFVFLLLLAAAPAAFAASQDSGSGSGSGSGEDDGPPPLKATLAACSTGADADQRFAVFTGSMPAYRGTRRMAMRFDLYTRPLRGRRWERVRGKGLSRWQKSDPNREGFVYTKRVERLKPDSEYRVVVRFRWYQAGDGRRRDRVRRTPLCRQPDVRPNLEIRSLKMEPMIDAPVWRYLVEVRNTGRTAAGEFDVEVSTSGDERRTVAGLPAGERVTVEVLAPPCTPGERAIARVDPERSIEESSERDNRFIVACDGR